MGVLDYDQTPGNNTSINGIGIQGTSVVQNFDNALRQYMADMAAQITRRSTKAANYTAVAADHNQMIEFTATATLSLTAAATLKDGWACFVKANGGTVTIDPNGAETINGASTFSVPDGKTVFILCNGTAFFVLLNIGSIGTQQADNIAVTGGTLSGITSFQMVSTDDGAATAPSLELYRNSTSPAASDFLGHVLFTGNDSGGTRTSYARIMGKVTDPTDGSEDASLVFQRYVAGTLTVGMTMDGSGVDITSGDSYRIDGSTGWVSQSYLKTAQSEQSTTAAANLLVLPGGAYGFAPTVRVNTSTNHIANYLSHENASGVAQNTNPGSAQNTCNFFLGTGSGTIWAAQRYVQASPPYDLGDGEIPLFIWVLVESGSGKVLATQSSQEAPWHNNGPTEIRPDFMKHGKKYRNAQRVDELQDRLLLSNADRLRAIEDLVETGLTRSKAVDAVLGAPTETVEIDQGIKQKDMPLIPHPWAHDPAVANGTAIPLLLDPVCDTTQKLAELALMGQSIDGLLHVDGDASRGLVWFGNEALSRSGPNGVRVVSAGWR